MSQSAIAADVDEEIRAHLDARVQQLVNDGMPLDDARRVALQRFGDIEATRHAMRGSARRHANRMRRRDRLSGIVQDMRHTFRQLRRAPAHTAVIIVILGLGIGATATMFGLVDRLLLRPPAHVRDPEQLGRLYASHLDGESRAIDQNELSYLRFTQLRDGVRGIADLAAMSDLAVVVGRGPAARRRAAAFVTANFWPLLGVRPALGRFFGPNEDLPPDGANVVVLGHAFWRGALNADSSIIGRDVDIGTRRFTVIGVTPPDFQGVTPGRIDLWLPATAIRAREPRLSADWYARNELWWLELVARLRPHATPQQAEAALTATYARVNMGRGIDDATVRERARVAWGPLLNERGPTREDSTRVAVWLASVAGIVLLLACSNVANLLLVRAIRRRREIVVRLALGISRGRLFAQLLMEGLLLATAGAAVGLAIALVGGRAVSAYLLPTLAPSEHVFDGRVLAFAMAITLVVGMLASLAPAFYALRQDINAILKLGNQERPSRRPGIRTILLAGQCALSTTLLLGAGLFIRSLQHARATPLGFDARRLLAVTVERRDPTLRPDDVAALYRQLAGRLRAVPGVINAATTMQIPFSVSGSIPISVPGHDSASLARLDPMRMNPVGTGYFETMGTRIIRGRALTAQDGPQSQRVMVVSDSMAKALWPDADPIGKCVKVGDGQQPCSIVVGVAENIHQYEVRPEPSLQIWFPESQNQGGDSGAYGVMIRVAADAPAMVPAVRRVLQSLVPPSMFISISAVGDVVDRAVRPWRIGALVLSAFGLLGLTIAAMGLYSVLSYTVSQRQPELGIRIALGATPTSLIVRTVREGMLVVLVGIGVGLVVAMVAGRSLGAVLLGVTATDPLVLPLTTSALVAVALLASLLPAWRASRIDPVEALRAE